MPAVENRDVIKRICKAGLTLQRLLYDFYNELGYL